MSIRTMRYLACDDCLNICDGSDADTASDARLLGRGEGWIRRAGQDLCPKCAANGPWYPRPDFGTWTVVRPLPEPDTRTFATFEYELSTSTGRPAGYLNVQVARRRAEELNAALRRSHHPSKD